MGPDQGPTATSARGTHCHVTKVGPAVGTTATSARGTHCHVTKVGPAAGTTATSARGTHCHVTKVGPAVGPLPRQHVGPTATSAKMGPAVGPTATSARGTHCHVSKNGSSNVYCYNATLQTPIMQRRLSSVAEDRKPRVYCNTFHATLGIRVAYEHLWRSVTYDFICKNKYLTNIRLMHNTNILTCAKGIMVELTDLCKCVTRCLIQITKIT